MAKAKIAAGLKAMLTAEDGEPLKSATPDTVKRGRDGKRQVAGFFSPELSRHLNMLAVEQDRTVQSLIGEALDLLFRHHGKHPFGEH